MRKWIIIVVLAGVAGVGAFLWLGDEPAPRAAVLRAEPGTAHYAPIATRDLDPQPLTVAEMFPAPSVSAGTTKLALKATETLADCAEAVWGSAQDALGGCTQVLRARYETEDGAVSGQFLIFNLADSAAADRLVAALKGDGGDGFVRPAPDTPDGFDGSRSWAQVRGLGHYVTVSWVAPVAGGSTARAGTGESGEGGEGGEGRVDLTYPQVAMDGLGLVIQRRLVR
ncbi:hypothetical protein ACFY3V_01100 [Streptosporangium sp. NPDC000095]|uniref:hypothetical protein n=1 Tax=Streptosporangium sp. NPDC000095 TaxID=3366184 RepID=UPI0036A4E13E